jgi:hypothetical protein
MCLYQPFSIFLPWRNPWNNFQVSGNPCIKIIISTAHGTLPWSVSCRYNNNLIIIVNALLSRELYFSVDLANKFKKRCLFFSITISRGTLGFHGTPVEKPWPILSSVWNSYSWPKHRNSVGTNWKKQVCSQCNQLKISPFLCYVSTLTYEDCIQVSETSLK